MFQILVNLLAISTNLRFYGDDPFSKIFYIFLNIAIYIHVLVPLFLIWDFLGRYTGLKDTRMLLRFRPLPGRGPGTH
jgi:hypothetical protein